ncbi:MAG: CapA family protein [Propionibacteriaceae bacterium]|nr:CapA family protein [Propionibacteriaceae bacterium]
MEFHLNVLTALIAAVLLGGCTPGGQADSTASTIEDSPSVASTGITPSGGQAPSETSSQTPSVEELPPTPEPPRTVSINYSGDLLWHNTLWRAAEMDAKSAGAAGMDFYPQLAALTDYVSAADVAICHSEVPFAPEGGPFQNYPMFAAPPAIAAALPRIGWDVCTTASNHSLDVGFTGLERTIKMHEDVGIITAGTFATPEAREIPVVFTTEDGVRVAVVSSTYGTNGIPLPKDKPWSVSLMDIDDILEQARRARLASDVVVVHMHAGDEYVSSPNKQQLEFAEAMTASPDVDLLVGQHAHVVQPITTVNDKWVAYGAGNLMAQSGPAKPRTYDGYLATFTFTEQDGAFVATAAEFAPTFITAQSSSAPARVLVISEALAEGTGDAAALTASAERTRKVVTSLGAEGLTEH